MSNILIRKIKEYRCRKMMKKYCEPREEFLNECRDLFVSTLCRQIPKAESVKSSAIFSSKAFRFGFGSFFGVFLIGSGAVAFADRQNVGYSHPLYPLKRLGETLKLTLASQEARPVLLEQFAKRRLEEIKEVSEIANVVQAEKNASSSTQSFQRDKEHTNIIMNLNNDLHSHINAAIKETENEKIEKQKATNLCQSILKTLDEDEELTKELKNEQFGSRSKFQEHCAKFIKSENEKPDSQDED